MTVKSEMFKLATKIDTSEIELFDYQGIYHDILDQFHWHLIQLATYSWAVYLRV